MSEELERYKESYQLLQNHITAQIALGHLTGLARSEASAISKLATEKAAPPPDFEDVPVTGWVNVYNSETETTKFLAGLSDLHETREAADDAAGPARISCQEITINLKRPVRRAVIREYEVAAKVVKGCPPYGDGACLRVGGGVLFADHPECHGKAGVLIFRTAE